MFKTKNLSPNQLSVFTSLVLSVPITLLLWYVEKSWVIALICFAVIFIGSYLLILVVLEKFIYRKIKLIYKFIYQTKASKKEEVYYKYILPKKSIDEVREDVEAWAEENKQEIEVLRQNEQFRKEFLQNLSHEFKTPVFAIQGYVETLLHGALENPEINKRFLEKTSKNVESAKKPLSSYSLVLPASNNVLCTAIIITLAVFSTSGKSLSNVVANIGGVTAMF